MMNILQSLILLLALQGTQEQGKFGDRGLAQAKLESRMAATPYIAEGTDFLRDLKYERAVTSFRTAMIIDPDAGLDVLLGEAYAGMEKWQEASFWYSRCVYPGTDTELPGPSWGCPKPMLEFALVLLKLDRPAATAQLYFGALGPLYAASDNLHVELPNDYLDRGLSKKRLEARVRLAYALAWPDERTYIPNLELALQLDPKLAAAKYYLGKQLFLYDQTNKERGRNLMKEAALSDQKIRSAVDHLHRKFGG